MKVIWTEKAEKQLDQIFEYIASGLSIYAHRIAGCNQLGLNIN